MNSSPRARGDSGVAFVLMGLSMIMLMMFVALVIDLGNGRQEKRHIQNAVDAAGLAGSTKYDPDDSTTEVAAMTEALKYLRLNDVPGPAIATAGVYQYGCQGGQDCIIELSFPGEQCMHVQVREYSVPTFFAGVVGTDEINVRSSASGCTEPGPPGDPTVTNGPDVPAGWAGGKCSGSDPGFDTSGNFNRFEGGIRAIDNPKDGSSNAQWTGARSYRGSIVDVGSLWANNPPPAPVAEGEAVGPEWPPGFGSALPVSLYAPGGARAVAYGGFYTSGTQSSFSGSIPAGVYYTTASNLTIGSVTITPRAATIRIDPLTGLPSATGIPETRTLDGLTIIHAGNGEVNLSTAGTNLRLPFELELNRLAMFSNSNGGESDPLKACGKPVVKFSAECIHVNGVVYVPRGAIENSGNGTGQSHNARPGCTARNYTGGMISAGLKLAGERNLYRGGPGSLVSEPGDPGPDENYLLE